MPMHRGHSFSVRESICFIMKESPCVTFLAKGEARRARGRRPFSAPGAGGAGRQILSHRTFLCAVRPFRPSVRPSVHLSLTPRFVFCFPRHRRRQNRAAYPFPNSIVSFAHDSRMPVLDPSIVPINFESPYFSLPSS